MSKLHLGFIFIITLLTLPVMVSGQDPSTWTWSSELEEGDEYEWEVTKYEVDGVTIESPRDEDRSFPIVEGSEIKIELLDTPSSYNLFDGPNLDNIFEVTVDGEKVNNASVLTFVFPVVLDSELLVGDNGFETVFGESSISTDGDETVIEGDAIASGSEGEVRYETETGLLQLFDLSDDSQTVIIEINSGFFSFLPAPSVWIFFVPLLAIPVLRKFRK